VLTAIEGRGYQEVADLLEMSPGTVASRVSRARASLALMLEGDI
jgi:DNA-directed RNA polymerase specialized sigma24 family protein